MTDQSPTPDTSKKQKSEKKMELKQMLLSAPDSQLDASLHTYINTWPDDDLPCALDILRILDYSARGSLASGFVMQLLDMHLNIALTKENITREDLIEMAPWRNGEED